MKYVKEFGIILIVSLVGELLNYFLPLPVPASIYGLVLMFLCLMLGVIKLSDVHDTACFLIEIMPIMFIPPAVGLMASWDVIQANLVAYLIIAAVTTIVVMAVSGLVTQEVLKRARRGRRRNDIFEQSVFSASLSVLLPTASACCCKKVQVRTLQPAAHLGGADHCGAFDGAHQLRHVLRGREVFELPAHARDRVPRRAAL